MNGIFARHHLQAVAGTHFHDVCHGKVKQGSGKY